eukprot:TRINITY_DN6257_c0_g2_i2.p2 TRINITY_DN6257_c0_g2~~TRINITY_DN6257_c0_g2_i2.p2  ORF type:complete len:241 (+),score=69.56 TRINITY_DN6257_c0_g2_i2:1217-1939(+)
MGNGVLFQELKELLKHLPTRRQRLDYVSDDEEGKEPVEEPIEDEEELEDDISGGGGKTRNRIGSDGEDERDDGEMEEEEVYCESRSGHHDQEWIKDSCGEEGATYWREHLESSFKGDPEQEYFYFRNRNLTKVLLKILTVVTGGGANNMCPGGAEGMSVEDSECEKQENPCSELTWEHLSALSELYGEQYEQIKGLLFEHPDHVIPIVLNRLERQIAIHGVDSSHLPSTPVGRFFFSYGA